MNKVVSTAVRNCSCAVLTKGTSTQLYALPLLSSEVVSWHSRALPGYAAKQCSLHLPCLKMQNMANRPCSSKLYLFKEGGVTNFLATECSEEQTHSLV